MALKLFEIVEQFIMDKCMLKLTKTGSIGKTFISPGNLIINFHFRNKSITYFVTFKILPFNSRFCVPFNNRNTLNLKRKHKTDREKSKLSGNKFYKTFPEKKHFVITKFSNYYLAPVPLFYRLQLLMTSQAGQNDFVNSPQNQAP